MRSSDSLSSEQVAAYVRLSREDLRQPGTLEQKFALRKEICLSLARQYGIPLAEGNILFERETATKLAIRPQAMALLERARSKQIQVIITPDQERLLRGDKRDEQDIEDALCAGKITLITTTGIMSFDENYEVTHGLVFSVKAAVARHYVADLVKRRKEVDLVRLRQNLRTRGYAPYGYIYLRPTYDAFGRQITPQRHEIDPREYPLVQEIFRRIKTENVHAIVRDFNARHVPAPGGSTWYRSSLRDILLNPFYAGHMAQRQQNLRTGRIRLKPEEYILSPEPGAWEHPISLTDWYELLAIMQGRRHGPARSCLLTGILYCCQGRAMYGSSLNQYRCECDPSHAGHAPGRDRLDGWAKQIVFAFLRALPEDALRQTTEQPKRSRAETDAKLRQARLVLEERQAELTGLIRQSASLSQRLNPADIEEALRAVTAERDAAKADMERLQALLLEPDRRTAIKLLASIKLIGIETYWDSETDANRRGIVQSIIRSIRLHPVPRGRTFIRGASVEFWELGQPQGFRPPLFVTRLYREETGENGGE